MITAFFVFTATMVIVGSFKMIGAMIGNGVTLPGLIPGVPILEDLNPTNFIIMYPSVGFQVWFWAERAGLFV